jgi:hypothetical protein
MSRKKYYTQKDTEVVYHLDHWIDIAWDSRNPIVIEGCRRDKGGEPWCDFYHEFIDTRDNCGKQCNHYDPRNGVSGCCTQCVQGFVGTGQLYTVTGTGYIRKTQNDNMTI